MILANNRFLIPLFYLLIPSILTEATTANDITLNENADNGLVCKFNSLPPRELIHSLNLVNVEPYTNTFTFDSVTDEDVNKLSELDGNCEKTGDKVVLRKRQQFNGQKGGIYDPFFKNFTTYDTLKTTLQFWCKNSQGWCNFVPVYGRSYEGRDLFGAIVTNPVVNQNKTYVWINAGLDGSSTLAPSTAAYMIRALIYDSYYPDIADLLQKYSFVFTPMANPDGFEYSRKNKVAWRKNRSVHQAGNFGVDLTRNFEDHFCQFGGSTNPKDTNYCGPKAFSEPETYYLLQFALKLQKGLWSILDMYDGGQMLARAPAWSYTYTMNNAIEQGITNGMEVALKQAGYGYKSVVASEAFGLNSGSLLDFAELQLHVPAFRLYLPPSSRQGHVSEGEILKASDAAYSSLLQMCRYMFQLPMYSNTMKPQGAINVNPGQIFSLLGQGIGNLFGGNSG